jgi:hypothetical protein
MACMMKQNEGGKVLMVKETKRYMYICTICMCACACVCDHLQEEQMFCFHYLAKTNP